MLARAMILRIPIGISDFRELREKNLLYVDKSGLLVEMIDREGTKVLLLPRPRRFGKTLNLSMIRCFFERRPEDMSHLFQDLAIWRAGEAYRKHFQRYPVIFLTFRGVEASTFDACQAGICHGIEALFQEHSMLLSSGMLNADEARDYVAILDGTAAPSLYEQALGDLSMYLHRATGERAFLLIDEFDTPIRAGFEHGYAVEIIELFRRFFIDSLKDNPHLERGVLTGVLRTAHENIFSGLNNLGVYTLRDRSFSTSFGFTEPEVLALLGEAGLRDRSDEVRGWYNGYVFGGTVMYNPWSVLNCLERDGEGKPYWLNTSANDLIKAALQRHGPRLQPDIEALLGGGGIETVLDENVVLDQIDQSDVTLWSLLVFSGYLKAERRDPGPDELAPRYFLSIPNREVRLVYTTTFQEWFATRMRGHGGDQRRLLEALLDGNAEALERQLGAFVQNVLSYHDLGADEPERIYQAFLLGLFTALEPEYRVRSNRESGKGRPDVLILPARSGKPGVVLELKVAYRKKTLAQALDEGIAQVQKKDYAAELGAVGAEPVHVFVIAFDGKEVRVQNVQP
jgi:hypothetical protein